MKDHHVLETIDKFSFSLTFYGISPVLGYKLM
jgi:hypothetical protein